MKVLFLFFHGFYESNGICKKVHYQINALKECGCEVNICNYDVSPNGHRVWMVDNQVISDFGTGIIAKVRKRIDFSTIYNFAIDNDIDVLYYRSFHNANPFTINFIKKIHQSGIKVLLEIPTYPYDKEYQGLKGNCDLTIDKMFRFQFCKYVDRIVTFSNENIIFNRPTIRISNGIDFNQLPLKTSVHDISKELHLIAVAEIHFWHGYDRLVSGLGIYYKNNPQYKVYLHLVGDMAGNLERNAICGLIEQYNLQSVVTLYGNQSGEALNAIFDKADFAVGSLGRHRSGILNMKSLKNREYAARGIPFIYSEIDDDFENMQYVLKAPANETPIDIQRIVDFVKSCPILPEEIRQSVCHLSWKNQMNKVIKSLIDE